MKPEESTSYLGQEITLTNCDTEPIHIPGAVQSHGCLVVIRNSNFRIVAVSDNLAEFLNTSPKSAIGLDVRSFFGDANQLALDPQILTAASGKSPVVRHQVTLNGTRFAVSRRTNEHLSFLQFEPNDNPASIESAGILTALLRNQNNAPVEDCYEMIVSEIRQATGFDRVMLYQFHEDLHGSVVAEECHADMEPFLGLHYPAGDIPLPARKLYERNWIRTIADTRAEPSALLADPDEPSVQPLDLSDCELRAVSPIHLEYLQNMKVGASLSISVMDGERLWGLICCHHNSPRHVTPQQRDTCELLGTTLSAFLTGRRQQDYLKVRLSISEVLPSKIDLNPTDNEFSFELEDAVPLLLEAMEADGVAWIDRQRKRVWHQTPSETILTQIVEKLRQKPDVDLAYTDQLSSWLENHDDSPLNCSGMVAISVGRKIDNGVLLIFRRPMAQKINWAGNPEKSVVDEQGRLSPRKSFEAFQQDVVGRSRPWSDLHKDTARSILATLKTLVVERAALLENANEELRQLNGDLDAFAYAASHDLKEPLRGIQFYARMLASADSLGDEEYQGRLQGLSTIVQRMDHLLDGLLRFSRAGRSDLELSQFDLKTAVEQTVDGLALNINESSARVSVEPNGQIRADVACVQEILANLLTNAIKYNESEVKQITVGLADTQQTPLGPGFGGKAIFVKDNGIGIAQKHHDEIFDVFRRLHGPDEFGGGSGAGLTIVRRMVERHGGRITLQSSPAGTTFYFTMGVD